MNIEYCTIQMGKGDILQRLFCRTATVSYCQTHGERIFFRFQRKQIECFP